VLDYDRRVEVKLTSSTAWTKRGSRPWYELFGTEQGLQLRLVVRRNRDGMVLDEDDVFSIGREELLRLMADFETGRLQPPYGTPGSGLETASWHWHQERPPG
jgi:hypothetical protein